jgi:hypothetical protein
MNRVQTSPIGVEYLDLEDHEQSHYKGAGDAIVYFTLDNIIERVQYIRDIPEGGAKAACDEALAHGNAWLGMMSTYQFTEPRRLDGDNPAGFARIARLVHKNWN